MLNHISPFICVLALATVAGAGGDVPCAAAPLRDVVARAIVKSCVPRVWIRRRSAGLHR
jgi:hypothetical protein